MRFKGDEKQAYSDLLPEACDYYKRYFVNHGATNNQQFQLIVQKISFEGAFYGPQNSSKTLSARDWDILYYSRKLSVLQGFPAVILELGYEKGRR